MPPGSASMHQLPFIKMHGCGNDYVFIDAMDWTSAAFQQLDAASTAKRISDRHRSIGSDGLVMMLASDRNDADARMRMYNADGSEGTLCVNALRCMAMWLHQSGRGEMHCRIAMQDRIIDTEVLSSDVMRKQANVRIDIGTPVVVSPDAVGLLKFQRPLTLADVFLQARPLQLTAVSIGNPHAIVLVDDVKSVAIETLGPEIERHPLFPDRTNVEFVQLTSVGSAIVRVWERGAGETQACGSGACAAAVMGCASGLFSVDQPIQIRMHGGDVFVRMSVDHEVSLEGPAEESFRGHLAIYTPRSSE